MPIDASIYSGIQTPTQINPLAQYGQMQQVQGAQEKLQEYTRKRQDDELLREAVKGFGSDSTANYNRLLATGNLTGATNYQKGVTEQAKAAADVDKTKIEAAHKRADLIGQGLGYLKDNPSIENAQTVIQNFVQLGIMPQDVAQQKLADFQRDPTPQGIGRLATIGYQGALSAKDQLPKFETRNLGGSTDTISINPVTGAVSTVNSATNTQSPDNAATNATSRANNAATVGATIRGQNLGDARAREANANGRVPAGYRLNAAGTGLEFIPGGPADPDTPKSKANLTEDQGKATGWLVQADNAWKNMQAVALGPNGQVRDAAKPGFNDAFAAVPGMSGAANSLRSEDRQKFIQSSSSLSEALLRAATGAGVNMHEAEQKIKEITPVFGDSDAVIRQKMESVPLYLESLKIRAGPGAIKAAVVGARAASPTAPNIDLLLRKYGGQ